jgi:hypothetical protein
VRDARRARLLGLVHLHDLADGVLGEEPRRALRGAAREQAVYDPEAAQQHAEREDERGQRDEGGQRRRHGRRQPAGAAEQLQHERREHEDGDAGVEQLDDFAVRAFQGLRFRSRAGRLSDVSARRAGVAGSRPAEWAGPKSVCRRARTCGKENLSRAALWPPGGTKTPARCGAKASE